MRSQDMNRCHVCGKPVLMGFTCDGCRDKGHRDLNCGACSGVGQKVISIANGK
jgi:hypothetical protein